MLSKSKINIRSYIVSIIVPLAVGVLSALLIQ